MSIRLVLSESRATAMLMGPAFAGRKGRKKKTQKEKDRGAEGEGGNGEEVRDEDQGMDVFTLYPLFF